MPEIRNYLTYISLHAQLCVGLNKHCALYYC